MALPVLVMGPSGAGKTFSVKNFAPEEVGIISTEKGRLPYKSDQKVMKLKRFAEEQATTTAQRVAAQYAWLERMIAKSTIKSIVIDDSQFLMANEFFDRAREMGYQKFTDIALNFRNLIHFINELEEDDKIVYFLHHSETGADGREKVKTIGKMLDEKLTVEGCFDVVLYCKDQKFFTQGDGVSTAKTPEGMFTELEIPNDLKAVDVAIRDYYGIEVSNAGKKKS